ncbi:ParB/Srx family N-terminal domain-containing protein [Paraburkholderia sp. EG287A]|uniref:ParB/Srx family N-terminal domain-containing protein n=1 Tax=unclassified Paraburkholderia TaxID=2615204 RepID=UPI0034D15FB9
MTRAPSRQWPADAVERWPIEKLIPSARNARTHTDEQIAQLAASIREWGWTIPVLVDESGGLIAGHGRVLAARQLGVMEVPVMIARGWSEAQKRAYMLADNKLALNAGWNDELLSIELADLQSMGFDLPSIGFSDAEIADALMGHDFTPGDAGGQGTLDAKQPIVCPKCGHAFTR